jgi:transposase-like protein
MEKGDICLLYIGSPYCAFAGYAEVGKEAGPFDTRKQNKCKRSLPHVSFLKVKSRANVLPPNNPNEQRGCGMPNGKQGKSKTWRSAEERTRLLAGYKASGQPLAEFCRERGLPQSTLCRWLGGKLANKTAHESCASVTESGFVKLLPSVKLATNAKRQEERVEQKLELQIGSAFRFLYIWSKQ